MIQIFKKIQNAIQHNKTYTAGLLQARVYRLFKSYTQEKLKKYHISTIDWALLGLLYEIPDGIRPSVLAEQLGVESPFVTVIIRKLRKLELVENITDKKDSRVKIMHLTEKGRDVIPKIEEYLKQETRKLVKDISRADLMTYLSVLEHINRNGKNIKIKDVVIKD